MSKPNPVCRSCRAPMTKGSVLDREHAGVHHLPQWTEGEPAETKFLGMTVGVKPKGEKRIPVETWRCPSCGLLESYAR